MPRGFEGPFSGGFMIFGGLIPFLFVSELVTRSPTLISSVPNFVKKVRFPLALIPVSATNVALMFTVVNSVLLVLANWILNKRISFVVLELPLLLIPLWLCGFGLAALFGALGVFFRDLVQICSLVSQVLIFSSPICYPAQNVPDSIAAVLNANPLTYFVTSFRKLLLFDKPLELTNLVIAFVASAIFAVVGLLIFQRTRAAFADVL